MVRKNWLMTAAAGLLVGLGLASSADAQFGGRGPGGGRGGALGLLRNEAVQKELGISDEAREKLTKLAESAGAEMRAEMEKAGVTGGFQALQGLSPEQRQEMQKKMADAMRTAQEKIVPQIKAALTPEQYARLQQIGWQSAGAVALNDPELSKELNLSADQLKQLVAAMEESNAKSRELFQGAAGGGGGFQEIGQKMQELNKARDEKMLGVLTADQKAAFEKLKGKPFDVAQLRGGPGGPGGRGRGPGGAGKPGRPPLEAKPDAP